MLRAAFEDCVFYIFFNEVPLTNSPMSVKCLKNNNNPLPPHTGRKRDINKPTKPHCIVDTKE